MTIQEKENALFNRWKQLGDFESFDEDGVVNPSIWETTTLKIVFVLKETNGLNGDLRKFLREDGSRTYFRTWNNIVRWAEVILFDGYSEVINQERRNYTLSHICAVNLKKESGGSKASKKKVRLAALNDRKFIKEQLDLYQPDIVIACGLNLTADALRDIVYEDPAEWKPGEIWHYKTEKINKEKEILVISMPHPNRADIKWSKKLQNLYNTLKKQ